MIFTRSIALAFALAFGMALTACDGNSGAAPSDDWRAALARGDGMGAEIALRKALDRGAARSALAPYLGEAALEQGDLDEARQWLAAGRFAPEVAAHGYHMLGRLRMREGDLRGAGQAFDEALRGATGDPGLWVDIARLRYRGGEQAQAIAASRKALALDPNDAAALLLRAQLVRDSEGNVAALSLLERGLKSTPDDPDLLADYAATLGELGRAGDMLTAVRRLAVVAPADRRAFFLQAVLAARAGNDDLARSLLQRGGDIDRQVPAAILLLAVLDLENGNPASAAQGLDRLLRLQPDNQHVRSLLARALTASGSDRELIARFADTADTPYIAELVGRAYEARGEREKAARYLDRAAREGSAYVAALTPAAPFGAVTRQAPADGANVVSLVRGSIIAGRLGDARTQAGEWLRSHPGSADAMALAGDAAFASRDPRGALAHYRAAAAIRRPWPLAKRMAAALEASGSAAAAEALIAAQIASEPNNAEAASILARRYAARGDAPRAQLLAAHAAARGS